MLAPYIIQDFGLITRRIFKQKTAEYEERFVNIENESKSQYGGKTQHNDKCEKRHMAAGYSFTRFTSCLSKNQLQYAGYRYTVRGRGLVIRRLASDLRERLSVICQSEFSNYV